MKRKKAKPKRKPTPKQKRSGRRLGLFQVVGIDGQSVATVVYSDGRAVPEVGEPYQMPPQRLAVYKALSKSKKKRR